MTSTTVKPTVVPRNQFTRLDNVGGAGGGSGGGGGSSGSKRPPRVQHEGQTKRETIVFFMCVGVVAMALGAALTWYGASRDLPDFYIIGPLLMIIGLVLTIMATTFIVRKCLTMARTRRLVRDTEELRARRQEELEKQYPAAGKLDTDYTKKRAPTSHEMYGRDNEERGAQARRATVMDIANSRDEHKQIAEMYEAELGALPPPPVTHPLNISEGSGSADTSCFTVPLKEVAPSGSRNMGKSDKLPMAAVYSEPVSEKPPTGHSQGNHGKNGNHSNKVHALGEEGRVNSAGSGSSRVTSGGRNKVSPSPESGVYSPPATPISKSGVMVEVESIHL